MVFWVAVTLLTLRTSCSESVGNVPKCQKSKLDAERWWSHARTKKTEPKRTKNRSIMSVPAHNLRASLLCSHAECLVRVRWNVNNGGFVKCTDWRVGRIGPLSVAGHNLRASLLCSHAECHVSVRYTQMEKHCTASPSFPNCEKWKGDAELKGFVKCTDLRVGRIGPLGCQRSHVILVTHI